MANRKYALAMGEKTAAQKIRDLAIEHPEYGHTKIANMVGVDRSYVYRLRKAAGLLPGMIHRPVIVHLERQNNEWVLRRAREYGLTAEEFISVVVTDARLEQE